MELKVPWRDQSGDQRESRAIYPCIWGGTGHINSGSGVEAEGRLWENEVGGRRLLHCLGSRGVFSVVYVHQIFGCGIHIGLVQFCCLDIYTTWVRLQKSEELCGQVYCKLHNA